MSTFPQFLNEEEDLWFNLNEDNADFVRKYRSTACPIMGDDDIEDDDDVEDDDDDNNEDGNDDDIEDLEDSEEEG